MGEDAIIQAVTEQWPLVGVLLLMFYRGARGAVKYLQNLETKFDAAQAAHVEHGRRLERALEHIAGALDTGVRELRDRTDRHSREISRLTGAHSALGERLDAIESGSRLVSRN